MKALMFLANKSCLWYILHEPAVWKRNFQISKWIKITFWAYFRFNDLKCYQRTELFNSLKVNQTKEKFSWRVIAHFLISYFFQKPSRHSLWEMGSPAWPQCEWLCPYLLDSCTQVAILWVKIVFNQCKCRNRFFFFIFKNTVYFIRSHLLLNV